MKDRDSLVTFTQVECLGPTMAGHITVVPFTMPKAAGEVLFLVLAKLLFHSTIRYHRMSLWAKDGLSLCAPPNKQW